jgi:PAS domain S-box-containing protein
MEDAEIAPEFVILPRFHARRDVSAANYKRGFWLLSILLTVLPSAYLRGAPQTQHLRLTASFAAPAVANMGHGRQVPPPASGLPTLTTAEQVRELTADQANRGYPVRLRAVVTYVDFAVGDFFAQDDTAGIYVNETDRSLGFRPGDLLEIEGVSEELDFAPQIARARYRRLGRAPLPRPRKVHLGDLLSTREDSQWVQLEGIVQDVELDRDHLKLDVVSEGKGLLVLFMDPAGLDRARLIDTKVTVTGVCAALYNPNNQLIGVWLAVPTSRQISIEELPATNSFSVPVRPISSLMAFTVRNTLEHRVRVQGTVTLQRPKGVFIQDGPHGLYIPSLPKAPLRPGDRVDVVGFADMGDYTPVLRHALYRRTGFAPVPPPLSVTAQDAQSGAFDTLRVRLDATLRDVRTSGNDRTFLLQDGDTLFEARIAYSKAYQNWSRLLGSRLRLTGICSVNVDRNRAPDAFNILLDSPDSVIVLTRPSWWTLRNMMAVVMSLAGLTLAIGVWVVGLRHRVRAQTEVIRQRLESEAALEKRYQRLFECNLAGVCRISLDGRLLECNDALITMLGYGSREEILDPQMSGSLIAEADREAFLQELKSEKKLRNREIRLQRRDGSGLWVIENATLVDDPDSRCPVIESTYIDITERKRAETQQRLAKEAAEDSEAKYRSLITNIPDVVWVADASGRVAFVSPNGERLTGLCAEDVDQSVTHGLFERLHPDDGQRVTEAFEGLFSREATYDLEFRVRDSRGEWVWVHDRAVAAYERDGVCYASGLRSDISERKQAEAALRARDAAEDANRTKSAFLATMSHELRTPLNAIIGYSQMLREDCIGPEQPEVRADLEKIERSGQLLLGIINDILDLSRIEAGRDTVKAQTIDVAVVLQDVSNALQPLARQQGNVLKIDCEGARLAYADLSKFRQSVLNLVNNALKFTEKGHVTVEVNRLNDGLGDWTEVQVSDTGIGISQEHLGKLFQPFSQVDGSVTRKHNGTGLGLAISKKFCQMMGGDITVESQLGRGSRFSIRVPAGPAAGPFEGNEV